MHKPGRTMPMPKKPGRTMPMPKKPMPGMTRPGMTSQVVYKPGMSTRPGSATGIPKPTKKPPAKGRYLN
jgi:hypothetical protein